jgi:hypothetical protein
LACDRDDAPGRAAKGIMGMIYQQLLHKIAKSVLGRGVMETIVAEDGKVTLKNFKEHNRRLKKLRKEFRQIPTHLKNLHLSCVDHMRPVSSPLVLISQIQRSGGSLLSQLFDGHPEFDAHPQELKIGYPTKYTWPKLDLNDDPGRWFETLFETVVLKHLRKGYKKQKTLEETFLFLFLPSVQRQLFLNYLDSVDSITLRDVFDAYMTSYFGAWLNNQNNSGEKKFISAFTPRLAMDKDNMEAFFEIYPDGRLISVMRDPKNWYPSAANHQPLAYGDIRKALSLWEKNARAMLWNKERYGDRVCILTFEDLVGKTEVVMRFLADLLKISFADALLIPTFNKYPIKANTSFKARQYGIINSTLNRYKTLSREQLSIIDSMTGELHREVLSIRAKIT